MKTQKQSSFASRPLIFLLISTLLLAACQAVSTSEPVTVEEPVAQPSDVAPLVTSDEPIKLDWITVKDPEDDYWQLETDLPGAESFNGQMVRLRPLNGTPTYNVWFFYSKKSSAYDTALVTILTEFRNRGYIATFTVINADYNAKDKEASLARFAQAIQAAQADQADLIFSAGSDGTAVFFAQYASLGIPIVSVNAKDPVLLGQLPDYETGSGTSMAFTSLNVPIDLQMNYLLRLKPSLKNIAVMYSSTNKSAIETQAIPIRKAAEAIGIVVTDVIVENNETAKEELAQKVPLAVAEMTKSDPGMQDSIFLITGDTTVFNEIPTINQYADKIAVLSMVPENVLPGDDSAVLAIGVSFVSNAQVAAYYATQILDGTDPGSLKVGIVSPPDIAINFKRARAIGLKVPFTFFEVSSFVYDGQGQLVRKNGQAISPQGVPVVISLPVTSQVQPTPTALPPAEATPTEVIPSEPTPTALPSEPTATPAPIITRITPENAAQLTSKKQLQPAGGNHLQLSPDGLKLAVYNPASSGITLYAVPSLEKLLTIPTGWLSSLVFSPDSSLLAGAGVDASINLWRTSDGVLQSRLVGLTRSAMGLAFSPAGDLLASASPDGLWLWPVSGGEPQKIPDSRSDTVTFSPDGKVLFIGTGNHLRLVQISDGATISEYSAGVLVNVSADGQYLAKGISQGPIQIISVADGKLLTQLRGSNPSVWMSGVFSPDGRLFAMIDHSANDKNWIHIWDLSSSQVLTSVGDYWSSISMLAFSSDGQYLVSINEDQRVDVWGIP